MKENIEKDSMFEESIQLRTKIHVMKPSMWLFVSAVIILLVCAIFWGCFGTISTTIEISGIQENGTIICYIQAEQVVKVGEQVVIFDEMGNEAHGAVLDVAAKPLSKKHIESQGYDDYALYCMNLSEWNREISIQVQDGSVNDGIVQLSLVTNEIRPIQLLIE